MRTLFPNHTKINRKWAHLYIFNFNLYISYVLDVLIDLLLLPFNSTQRATITCGHMTLFISYLFHLMSLLRLIALVTSYHIIIWLLLIPKLLSKSPSFLMIS